MKTINQILDEAEDVLSASYRASVQSLEKFSNASARNKKLFQKSLDAAKQKAQQHQNDLARRKK